jgi:hypothetical protein
VLPVGPAVATTVVEEDADSGPSPAGVPIPSVLPIPSDPCKKTWVVVIDPMGCSPWAPKHCDD